MRCSIIGASTVFFAGLFGLTSCGPTTTTCADYIGCNDAGGAGQGGSSGTGGTSGGQSGTSGGGASGGSGHGGAPNGGNSGAAGAAGDSGAGTGGEVVPPCDSTRSPGEEACVVDDNYAIFVAPTGKDTSAGTKAGPVKTIAKAVSLAGTTKIVIACDGTYDEQVKLTAGVKLYGGFACPGSATPWSYEASKKATVAPSARGLALSIASGASSVVIEDFEFDAQDGVDPGESSVAAFVNTSTNVALTRVKLVAGKGVDGANGSLSTVTFPTQAALNGHAASGDTGGTFNLAMCLVGASSTGASGGNGGSGVTGGGLGMPDLGLGMGKGGVVGADCSVGLGTTGANASPKPAASGAMKLGAITVTGWIGTPGTDGAPGSPGQGGGGGAGAASGGGGGGGAAGGCGGAGGTAGKAGGSSIALLVLSSTLATTANQFVASDAGRGGAGAAGQDGQPLSANGGLPDASGGCQGGKGGKGGAGGAGGGAAGGVSVGIAYMGATAPMPDAATTITTGTAGGKGVGGVAGTNDGIAGVKQDVLQVL